jgi:hypothetical protein
LADIPDDEIDKITHLNAMKHFNFDPFKDIPRENCTVGALRAQAEGVDLSPLVGVGGNPAQLEPGQIITTADIMRQVAPAFAND